MYFYHLALIWAVQHMDWGLYPCKSDEVHHRLLWYLSQMLLYDIFELAIDSVKSLLCYIGRYPGNHFTIRSCIPWVSAIDLYNKGLSDDISKRCFLDTVMQSEILFNDFHYPQNVGLIALRQHVWVSYLSSSFTWPESLWSVPAPCHFPIEGACPHVIEQKGS